MIRTITAAAFDGLIRSLTGRLLYSAATPILCCMSLRLWRRKQLFPGLRMNLSKSCVSVSVGRRGAWYTAGRRGQRVTVGAPGTGLFWTEKLEPRRTASQAGRQWLGVFIAIAAIVGLVLAGHWIAAHP